MLELEDFKTGIGLLCQESAETMTSRNFELYKAYEIAQWAEVWHASILLLQ